MPYRRIFLLLLCFLTIPFAVRAQRAVGAEKLVLDDGSGNTITIQTPSSGWTGDIPFQIPIPPTGNPLAGFVHTGTALGQILEWNPTDGVQGAWDATTISSLGGITGTGTSGMIPLWTGTSTQANSHLTENYSTSGQYSATSTGEQLLATDASATNISIALQPKGNGAIEAQMADGTAAGGNARGGYAVDWQMERGADTKVASGFTSVVGGGNGNMASAIGATVAGGESNSATFQATTVGGGANNTASNAYSTVGGGYFNTASGNASAIPGGIGLVLSGSGCFGYLSNNPTLLNNMTVSASNTSVFGNTDLWLANNDDTARALYFYAPYNTAGAFPNGDNYVGFKAGAVTSSVIWTLPLADGTNGQALVTNGTGTLSWGPGGLSHITEAYNNSVAPYSAGNAGEQLLASGTDANISVALQPKGNGALEAQIADGTATGGNARGNYAVDWQMFRSDNTRVASGTFATVSGGRENIASGFQATVSGGKFNNASGGSATVSGGVQNTASNTDATVSGGYGNTASGGSATVSGGYGNTSSGDYSAIPGGEFLTLSGHDDFGFLDDHGTNGIPMSIADTAVAVFGNTDLWLANNDGTQRAIKFFDQYSTAGVFPNTAKWVGFEAPDAVTTSTIWKLPAGDGSANQVLQTDGAGNLSWGPGGLAHITESYNNSVAPYSAGNAGEQLLASGTDANISVALQPKGNGALEAQIADGTIAGGNARGQNAVDWQMHRSAATQVASGNYSAVSGGVNNTASGNEATVSGGNGNTASGVYATVSGGSGNQSIAGGGISTISGGFDNTASGTGATVSGGSRNTASGDYSTIPGGEGLTLSGFDDFGFLSRNDNTGNAMSISANNTSVFGNTDLWLADNDGAQRAIKFFDQYSTAGAFPNTAKWVGFEAPDAVTTSTIWKLPAGDGSANQVLQTDGAGNLSWGPGGLAHITESYNNSVAPYSAGNAGEQLLASGTDANVSIALQPKGAGALEAQIADGTATGGNARGGYAVDWQMYRLANTQVASGADATVSGGDQNTASGFFATVSGGEANTASGTEATVSGGYGNTASSFVATVSGGRSNTASNTYATVSGGYGNTASGIVATVSGGNTNAASGDYSAIAGGEQLTLSGHDDFGFLGLNDGTGNAMTVSANQTSVFGNTDLWLANNDGTQRAIKFFDQYSTAGAFPNTSKYVGFEAPNTVTTSTIWKLPVSDGSANQVLQTDGAGNLSWGVLQALDVYNTSSEAVTSGSAVPFSTTQFSSGSVTFGSSTNATIGIAGNYRVEFSVYPTAAATYELQKNGTAIASSVVSCAANAVTQYSTLISCSAADVITLVNAGGSSSTLNAGGAAVDAALEITLIK